MKFILSRKGFDSSYGGMPSPVFPDGTMLSLPIPEIKLENGQMQEKDTKMAFEDLNLPEDQRKLLQNIRYKHCHLDPDIRKDLYQTLPDGWKPLFGQCGGAQTHLSSNGVSPGDIFLFFGLFQRVIMKNGSWRFDGSPFHVIWGYLQIDAIVTGADIKKYNWHPHSHYTNENNTLYIGREKLSLDETYPGYGTFKLKTGQSPLILTLPNPKKCFSYWDCNKLPWLDTKNLTANMTGHNPKENAKDERRQPGFKDKDGCLCRNHTEIAYFQSVSIGQEFVIAENQTEIIKPWFHQILSDVFRINS